MKRTLWLLMLVTLLACRQSKDQESQPVIQNQEDLIQFHIQQKEKEAQLIRAYVERRDWPVVKTPTGLSYFVYHSGSGDSITTGRLVSYNFSVELLDGSMVYSSDSLGTRSMRIGQSEGESGLHEAFTYLSSGDKAKIIIPSHLAFGLTGDYNKIPSMATLVYDVEILNVK